MGYIINYIKVPKSDKRLNICELLNERYAYVKFCMDYDNNITLRAGIPTTGNVTPLECMLLLKSLQDIADKEYENIMKTIWS